jgi:chromosome segregation ATPase
MPNDHDAENQLKKALEQKPGLEHNVAKLRTQLQEAEIELDKCNATIEILTKQLNP